MALGNRSFLWLFSLLLSFPHTLASYDMSYHTSTTTTTYTATPTADTYHIEPFQGHTHQIDLRTSLNLPFVRVEDTALILRYTAELNRRLEQATLRDETIRPDGAWETSSMDNAIPPDRRVDNRQLHPWGVARIRPAPSRMDALAERLTIFHAKTPRSEPSSSSMPRRGVARWGPDLHAYLQHLMRVLSVNGEQSPELALALMYLDRACSVETPRSPGIHACPLVTPRTAHRLVLTAFLVSVEAWQGKSVVQMYDEIKSLGIPLETLLAMTDWMKEACGHQRLLITPEQTRHWTQSWEARFPSAPLTSVSSQATSSTDLAVPAFPPQVPLRPSTLTTTKEQEATLPNSISESELLHPNHLVRAA
jgi:hypothetical protein